ncbi:hypothetical protein VE23_23600 [Paenibacillus sp. D9]|nr:hypothetical protein VE23_23600 [Paenibacillus sp. D9]
MLLSLANALFLVFTLLWGLMGIIEFRILFKLRKSIKKKLDMGRMEENEYLIKLKRLKLCFVTNMIYFFVFLFQLFYVIYNWDQVDV